MTMKKFLCSVMATLVAVAAMAVGMPRNAKAPTYQVKANHVGKLQHKQGNSFGKLLPKLSASDLRKAPTLKAVPDAMWATFTMGLEDIEDPGIYSFHLSNQFAMGEKIIGNAKTKNSLFTNATASVVGDSKVFLSSWYGYAAIYDLATGETLMQTGTEALGNVFYCACYDKESKLVYGAFFNSGATGLQWCSFDLNTHVKTVIADVSNYAPIGCDFDADGKLWFIGADGTFYYTDKNFRNVQTLGNLGVTPACEYSNGGMCIDRSTNVLYWAFDYLDEDDGYLYPYLASVNLNTYAADTYQSNFIFAGMYMPVDVVEDKDVPCAPASVTLKREGNNAVITWDAVTTNEAGEAITGVTYNVICKNTGETVATGVTGTTYTVTGVEPEGYTLYQYVVVAVCNGKTSKATESNKVAFGDAYLLPHTFPIDPAEDVDQFTIVDANHDGTTWFYEERGIYQVFTITENATHPKDDWLITPPVKMKASNSVRMRYVARATATNYPETMEIKVGKAATPEAMTVQVQPATVYSNTSYTVYDVAFTVPEDGIYFVGFHAISPADQYEFYIDNIVLEEGAAVDAPAMVKDLKLTPAAKGAHECDVEFTAPSTTAGGAPLTGNFSINVLCGDKLVKTFSNCVAGQKYNFTDTNVPNGFNTYGVVAVNAQGAPSDTVKAEVYVGYGTPRVARNCKLRVVDGNLVASWDTPDTEGINGYVDPARVSHNIYILDEYEGELVKYRTSKPGELSTVLLANCNKGEQNMLSVYVEAVDVENQLVSGKRVETNKCLYGKPYDMPYIDNLSNSDYEWYVAENAVGTATDGWQYGVEDGEGILYVKCDYPTAEAVVNTGKIAIAGAQHTTLVFDQYLGDMPYNDDLLVQVGADGYENLTTVATLTRNTTPESPWVTRVVDLSRFADAEWICIQFKALGAPQGQAKRYYQEIRNVRVMNANDEDLSLKVLEVSNNGELRHNSSNTIKVEIFNNGATVVPAGSYSVVLSKDKKTVYTADVADIEPLSSKVYNLVYSCAGPDEDDVVNLTASVVHEGDPNRNNNSEDVTLKLVRPVLPTVNDLDAKEDEGNVLLTWNIPESEAEAVENDFEDYSAFSVGDEVLADQGYTIYFNPQPTEKCGSGSYPHAGEAIGWLVFDNKKAGFGASGAYAPRSGNQCLVAFDGSKKMDTWLITPELSGNEQTITFYTSALTGNWGNEEFNVLYSTTGTDKGDFIQINLETLTEREAWSWTERKFTVPQGTKYFAIQVVSTDKMGFKIDDFSFETGKALSVDVTGYNITVDGVLAKTVDGKLNSPILKAQGTAAKGTYMEMPKATTTYGVSIVTPWGVGEERTVVFEVEPTGINDLTIDGVNNGNHSIYDLQGRKLRRVSEGGIYLINGKKALVK